MIANETTLYQRRNGKKLKTIIHRTDFYNDQSPYRIVSYKKVEMTNVK